MADTLTLIDRVQDLQDRAGGTDRFDADSPPMLVQVFDAGNIPTELPGIFATHPVRISGPNGEGQMATLTASSRTIYVVVVGSVPPVAGDYLQARQRGGRWYAQTTRSQPCCQPCCTSDGEGEEETVTWDLQSEIDQANAINGLIQYYWYVCFIPSRGVFNLTACYNTPTPAGTDCQLQPFVICGELDVSTSDVISAPVDFNLTYSDGGMASQVVPLFKTVLDGTRWGLAHIVCLPYPNQHICTPTSCAFTVGRVELTKFAQVYKTCVPGEGTTYTVAFAQILTAGSPLAVPPPTDLRGLPYVYPRLYSAGYVDSFVFPADGSYGVVSCHPLLLSASHNVTNTICGITPFTSLNSITVTKP